MREETMTKMLRVSCGLLVIGFVAVAAAGGPIVKQRAECEMEVDLGMVVDDFLPSLLEIAAAEEESAPEKIEALATALGLEALDRLHINASTNDERSRCSMSVTLDPAVEGGLLADLFAIPQEHFRFGRYIDEDETVMVLYLAGMRARIEALNRLLGRPEIREAAPMIPADPLAITSMWNVDAREEILPFLSGELDYILFPCGEGQDCKIPKLAVVIGLTDGLAFREKLMEILARIMGEEKAAGFRDVEGETVGDFTLYPMWQDISYAVAPGFGVITTDPDGLKSIVGEARGNLGGVKATSYFRLNGDLFVEMIKDMAAHMGDDSKEAKVMAELIGSIGDEPIGTIEYFGRTGKSRWDIEIEYPSSVFNAYYRLIKNLFAMAPKLQAMESGREKLQDVVHVADEALTSYGVDHDGTFPESLEELVAAGYLDELPELQPTPLGEYVDRGYTYLPLRDETGRVVGHYFFVYGVGENSGHDVFTPENLAERENFRVAKDGENDGVVGFSYDGIALQHVEEWRGE
jgi:hypothetical protein